VADLAARAPARRTFTAALRPERIADNLARVRERIAAAGADPARVEVCAAIKYVPAGELPALAEAGVELVGENRAQELAAKQSAHRDLFAWDFIGALQSRRVRDLAGRVRVVHSLASRSALRQLARHPVPEALIEVNVAEEEGKAGIPPRELGEYLAAAPVAVTGLMTMPPAVADPERSRPHFARLAELAAEHGLERLSMGTTQDFEVAVSEGATIVRLGAVLYEDA